MAGGRFRRLLRAATRAAAGTLLVTMTAWATLAVCFSNLSARPPRFVVAAAFAVASATLLLWVRPRRWGVAGFLALFVVVAAWWVSIEPSNQRDWDPSCARSPTATIAGDTLVVRDLRNFDYASKADFIPRYETRTYDLSTLAGVDYYLCYFGPRTFAHAMMSFGFDDGRYLLVSIEARREKGEKYSPLQGLFKQYELLYVFADERDAVRLRTNFRNEDVYLYRTNISRGAARELLLSYVHRANRLAQQPEFYHARTSNCMTNLADHVSGGAPRDFVWAVALNGYSDRYAYDLGLLDRTLSFQELRRRSRINDAARVADVADFSATIRRNLPSPPINGPRRVEEPAPAPGR